MDDTKKMLKAIINGQNTMKPEILNELKSLNKKISKMTINFGKNIHLKFEKLNKSLDLNN